MMNPSCIQLSDLPNEILMIILKNLSNIEVLYSLSGANKRLNEIVHDAFFTKHLSLLKIVPSHLVNLLPVLQNLMYPLRDSMLDRFCSEILPEISDKIQWLNLESFSMKRILLATRYPNLFGLGLYNIPRERAIHLLSDTTIFSCSLKNQISSFVINLNGHGKKYHEKDTDALLFIHICTIFPNLRFLIFHVRSFWYEFLINTFSPTLISSTLLELHVNLICFTDCLYILDGRLNQLRTLRVEIFSISRSTLVTNNKDKLPNLRSFILSSKDYTNGYAELIVPLLHRMINLEKLDLSLTVLVTNAFIDGNDLKQNIISYMPRLKELTFNIRSIWFDYQFNLPSNKDIQETFKDLNNMQIISCVDYFQKRKYGQCRIYSCPYKLEYYLEITNNFPGGLFKYVREVSLYDEYPFEHEFFLRIAQSFPILDKLTLNNQKRQKNKRIQNQHLSIIKYPHLIELDLAETHQDYHEQFLFDTKTCLPNNVRVLMNYLLVKKVTRNFRRNTTRTNCAKMIYVNFRNKLKFPEHLKDYFPNAIIS